MERVRSLSVCVCDDEPSGLLQTMMLLLHHSRASGWKTHRIFCSASNQERGSLENESVKMHLRREQRRFAVLHHPSILFTLTMAVLIGSPFLLSQSRAFRSSTQMTRRRKLGLGATGGLRTFTVLYAEKNNASGNKKKNKGVYARPSAAIERGSGFFVPGLEGPRVRLLFGGVVLILTALNRILGSQSGEDGSDGIIDSTIGLSETLAVGYSLVLLLQAAIEFSKADSAMGAVTIPTLSGCKTPSSPPQLDAALVQQWSKNSSAAIQSDDDYRERVQWAAASFISMTPATHMLLLDSDDPMLYRLGSTPCSASPTVQREGVQAALETLSKSTGGRVSLPLTHPAAQALSPSSDGGGEGDATIDTRCVVLQRITDSQCWMMTSNQLLAAFTKSDLKFLGQLAKYVSIHP